MGAIQELTEYFSSALLGVGWMIPICVRPTRAFCRFSPVPLAAPRRRVSRQAARCASTGDHQPVPFYFFCGSSIFSPFLKTP
jgi:hypothetical protein